MGKAEQMGLRESQSQKPARLQGFWVPVLCYSPLKNSVPKIFVRSFHQMLAEPREMCSHWNLWNYVLSECVELHCHQGSIHAVATKQSALHFYIASTCNDSVSGSAASDIQVIVLIHQSHNSTAFMERISSGEKNSCLNLNRTELILEGRFQKTIKVWTHGTVVFAVGLYWVWLRQS